MRGSALLTSYRHTKPLELPGIGIYSQIMLDPSQLLFFLGTGTIPRFATPQKSHHHSCWFFLPINDLGAPPAPVFGFVLGWLFQCLYQKNKHSQATSPESSTETSMLFWIEGKDTAKDRDPEKQTHMVTIVRRPLMTKRPVMHIKTSSDGGLY